MLIELDPNVCLRDLKLLQSQFSLSAFYLMEILIVNNVHKYFLNRTLVLYKFSVSWMTASIVLWLSSSGR